MKWLLLITTLPTRNATARMRVWRSVKASGAVVLRDGVYLLPDSADRLLTLKQIESDVNNAGGSAYLLETENAAYDFYALFDRTGEYQALIEEINQIRSSETTLTYGELNKSINKLSSFFNVISGIDFFPGEAQRQTRQQLDQLQQSLNNRLTADEPHALPARLSLLNRADYQNRLWATRRRPWVDRLASAWLIHRFIDPGARFLWLQSPAECPAEAPGFDFDGAEFSHVETAAGTWVTFETLLFRFGLDSDPALKHIASLIHVLDVGGLPVAEAAGIERLLKGMRERLTHDDDLLASAETLFNDLYLAYQSGAPQP